MNIAVVSRSTVSLITQAWLDHVVAAMQVQMERDFLPAWRGVGGLPTEVVFGVVPLGDTPPPRTPSITLFDHSDQVGAIGYHLDADRVPASRVFAADDLAAGVQPSSTLSHEACEMVADPLTSWLVRIGAGLDPNRYSVEVCDPVESDSDGYLIGDVLVSNFVLPSYFGLGGRPLQPPFDHLGNLRGPCPTRAPGGYQAFLNPAGGWDQLSARLASGRMSYRSQRRGRGAFRAALI